jgi:hypothetical protein
MVISGLLALSAMAASAQQPRPIPTIDHADGYFRRCVPFEGIKEIDARSAMNCTLFISGVDTRLAALNVLRLLLGFAGWTRLYPKPIEPTFSAICWSGQLEARLRRLSTWTARE